MLALDCSAAACSAALTEDGRLIAHRFVAMERGQAEAIIPMARSVVGGSGEGFRGLDGVAVTVGPGAFTGIRIGLAAARGIALAAGVALWSVTSFEAVAHGTPAAERVGRAIVVVLDTKRSDLYVQVFTERLEPFSAPAIRAAAALPGWLLPGPLLIAGDAAESVRLVLAAAGRDARSASGRNLPDAIHVAEAARRSIGAAAAGRDPRPLYLRSPEVSTASASVRNRP
ncbi:MAG: tRNA (adenosine(37)-N6)-threonylcarbamoyltransferase complex dimerization subunit type 1 TsaB [Alphaproteobacteria bacterium]